MDPSGALGTSLESSPRYLVDTCPLLVQLACLPAIYLASHRILSTWKIRSASEIGVTGQGKLIEDEPLQRNQRVLQVSTLALAIILAICSLIPIGIARMVGGEYRYKWDYIISMVEWFFLVVGFYTANNIFLPSDYSTKTSIPLRYMIFTDTSPHNPSEVLPRRLYFRTRFAIAITLASLVIILSSLGYKFTRPIIGAMTVTSVMVTRRYSKLSIRMIMIRSVQFVGLVGVISAVTRLERESSILVPGSGKTECPDLDLSEWLVQIMFVANYASALVIPGIFIALVLRFEHSLAMPNDELPILDTSVSSSRYRPIFHSSLLGLLLGTFILDALPVLPGAKPWLKSFPTTFMGTWVTLPMTVLGSGIAASWNGCLKEWMLYEENWSDPSIPEVETSPLNI